MSHRTVDHNVIDRVVCFRDWQFQILRSEFTCNSLHGLGLDPCTHRDVLPAADNISKSNYNFPSILTHLCPCVHFCTCILRTPTIQTIVAF